MVIGIIVGALIALICLLIGFAIGRAHRSGVPKLICGCTHHKAKHDPQTSRCHEKVKRVTKYNGRTAVEWVMEQCLCRHYVGPDPLAEYNTAMTAITQGAPISPDVLSATPAHLPNLAKPTHHP